MSVQPHRTQTPTSRPILVVDDDPTIQEVVTFALESEGYTVIGAEDGEQALEIATRERPALVILDLRMPRLDGVGAATRLRSIYGPSLPILFLSADFHLATKARQAGVPYLKKPFDLDELLRRVHALLRATTGTPATP